MTEDEQEGAKAPETGAGERQPIFNLPGVVMALAGAMIAIHLVSTLALNEMGRLDLTLWLGFLPVRALHPDSYPAGFWPLLWTPFSHAFLHASFEHLAMNVVWLAIFATPVARRYGWLALLIVFFVSSGIGALAFAVTTLPEIALLVGASGGVAGLTGAAVRFMFQPVIVGVDRRTGERVPLGRKLATVREVLANPTARNFTLIWVVLNAAVPLLPMLIGQDISIAWQAHLGGFFTGFFLVPLLERDVEMEGRA